ncbi:MAG: dephospho-CoA kinase [Anaerovoracaceae bacterium]
MRIGITGGIGSGKSTVSDYLIAKGYKVIDADKIAREIVMPGKPALKKLVEVFGESILDDEGELRRKYLAKIVFEEKSNKQALDEVMQKEILDKILDEFEKNEDKLIFLDAPLLFEGSLNKYVDFTWVITIDEIERINRVVKRDGIAAKEVKARINNQMPEEEKTKLADEVIYNSSTKEELYLKIDEVLSKYEK